MSDDYSPAEPASGAQPRPTDFASGSQTEPGSATTPQPGRPKELGGPKGPEPTRYGDWERNGRCSDF